MGIVIGIDSRLLEFSGPEIVIGSSSVAHLSLPNDGRVAERHAVMRLVAGRWLIEAQGDAAIRVGDGRPTKVAWLNPGDVIDLTESGPRLTFSPAQTAAAAPMTASVSSRPHAPTAPAALIAALAGSVLVLALAVLLIAWRAGGTTSQHSTVNRPGQPEIPQGGPQLNPAEGDADPEAAARNPLSVEAATYLVLLEDPVHKRQTRHGMACAVGPRELVTSAYSVALAIIRGRESSPVAKIQGRDADQAYQITDIKLYPKFDELVYQVEQLQSEIQKLVKEAEQTERSGERGGKKKQTKINDDIRHIDAELQKFVPLIGGRDLAVLVVDRDLPSWLPTAGGDKSVTPGLKVSLVGYPWPANQPLFHPEETLQTSTVTAQLSQKQEIENVKPYLWLVRFGDITRQSGRATDIWSGSPVVDGKQRLIGVYTRTHPKRNQEGFDLEWHEVTSIDSLGDIK